MNESIQTSQNESVYCKDCGEILNKNAKKCYHCGKYKIFNWIQFFNSLSSATAFIIVIISVISLLQTCQKRHDAEEAFIKAEQALKDAQKANVAAEAAKTDAISKAEELIQNLKTVTNTEFEKISRQLAQSSETVKVLEGRIEKERSDLDDITKKTTAVSNELQLFDDKMKFQQTLNAARNDDKKSYDQLKNWSEDDTYLFREDAKKQYRALQKDPSFIFENAKVSKLSKESLEKLLMINKNNSFEEIVRFYNRIDPTQPYMKPSHIIYIVQYRTDIPIKKRFEFLIGIIKSDDSLSAAKTAEYAFWQLVGKRHDEWYDEALMLKYWNENKDKY